MATPTPALSQVRTCPRCGLTNTTEALRCDCGYDFTTGKIERSYTNERISRTAFSLNGIGTKFYGQRDFHADGSYITTQWLVFLYLPLIPLRSLRVVYDGPGDQHSFIGLGSSSRYAVYERSRPNRKQVLYTYAYIALVSIWTYQVIAVGTSLFPHALDTIASVWLVFIACMVPLPTPWIMRYIAARKAQR